MKLYSLLAVAASFLQGSHAGFIRVSRDPEDHRILFTTNFNNDDASGQCLGHDPIPKVRLGSGCTSWRVDDDGLFHSEDYDDFCMQAGHGGTPGEGTKLRLYGCDKNNHLQRFDYSSGVVIKLENTNWCVAFSGSTGSTNDEIVLKDCDTSGGTDNWSTDGW